MKKTDLFTTTLLCALAISAPVLGQSHVAVSKDHQTHQVDAAPTAPSARADLMLLRGFLDQDRSYSVQGRAAAAAEMDLLEARADTLSPVQLAMAAARIAAFADNGHTFAVNSIGGPTLGRIPYRLLLMQGRLYVVDPGDDAALTGAELLSVNGVAVERIRQAFHAYRGGIEGWRDQGVAAFAETPGALAADGLIEAGEAVELTLRGRDGAILARTVSVRAPESGSMFGPGPLRASGQRATAPDGSPQPLYLRTPAAPFVTADAPELQALYIGLRATNDQGGVRIADFLAAAEAEIAAKRPRNIVLDLRFNGGGNLNTARAFAKALPWRLPADGRVFAITSPGTFSAAISTLGYLEEAGGDRVVIVGEPVGDRLEFWAEGEVVRLPWSGTMLLYATERHNYQTGCPEDDCHGSIRRNPIRVADLQPDLSAPMTVEAFMSGRDPAMEAIAAFLARER